jgi:transcriptional regulator with XRE-family HTH domain
MTSGLQFTALLKKRKLSQREIRRLIETSENIINEFEIDEIRPFEVQIRITNALKVCLDFMIGKTNMEITNLPTEDKEQVSIFINPFIRNFAYAQ